MTGYTTIASTEYAADAPLTTTWGASVSLNPTAITEGAIGAPRIQSGAMDTDSVNATAIAADAVGSSEIAAAAVAQSELKTTNSDHDLAWNNSNGVQVDTNAGLYALSVCVQTNTTSQASTHRVGVSVNGLEAFEGAVHTSGGTSGTHAFRVHYVQASPPYDLGDGEVPLFACLAIRKGSGEIDGISVAPDPVWANNGPTLLSPDGTLPDGRRFRWASGRRREVQSLLSEQARLVSETRAHMEVRRSLLVDRQRALTAASNRKGLLRDASLKIQQADEVLLSRQDDIAQITTKLAALKVPITMEMKMSDMPVIPHNYVGWDTSKYEFVYLDPCETGDLYELHADGMFLPTYIREAVVIDNRPLTRSVPPGCKAVRFSKR